MPHDTAVWGVQGVPKLLSAHRSAGPEPGLLAEGLQTLSSLAGCGSPVAHVYPYVGGVRVQGTLGLIPTPWWVKLDPRICPGGPRVWVSASSRWDRAQGSLGLMLSPRRGRLVPGLCCLSRIWTGTGALW